MVTLLFPMPERPDASFEPRATAPGRFIMMWMPGLDEKPYAISMIEDGLFGVTVMRRGRFSTALHQAGPGTLVGFRGPYGRGFWGWQGAARPERRVLAAGGCGMAPLRPLAARIAGATIIQGAPAAEEVLFRNEMPNQIIFTEDGSLGRKGYPTLALQEILRGGGADAVYACGPEVMLATVARMCRQAGVPCQVSIERYMKCGFGLCGQCECDGRLACKDGPVFSADELSAMPSFGRVARSKTGQKVDVRGEDHCAVPPR
jgi:dihydroorotate dehydrogenase electron transfer subunit